MSRSSQFGAASFDLDPQQAFRRGHKLQHDPGHATRPPEQGEIKPQRGLGQGSSDHTGDLLHPFKAGQHAQSDAHGDCYYVVGALLLAMVVVVCFGKEN